VRLRLGKSKIVSRSYALKKVQEETSMYTKVAERSVVGLCTRVESSCPIA
jgi:hypothetical protein